MKQLLQDAKNGELTLAEVPVPALQPGGIVVRNHFSVISAGTDRATMDFARKSLLGKARSRPDLVRQVVQKARRDGVKAAYQSAMGRLSALQPLGYSSAGEVIEVGELAGGFRVGDLVACAGVGFATHAEYAYVPTNLAVRLPQGVDPRHGAFGTLGAIALQGIRRAELTPGERVVVIGLGLIGQITAQVLRAYGFPVLGLDVNAARVEQAEAWGIDHAAMIANAETEADDFSDGYGADAAIITASTVSSDPIALAGRILRERGRVAAVGDVGLNVPRRDYYAKELDLRISRSYGPGRYDPSYEDHGLDYPLAYARWTEKRNIEEYVRLLSTDRIDVESITTRVYPVGEALEAYASVVNPSSEAAPPLGVLLAYPTASTEPVRRVPIRSADTRRPTSGVVQVGLIGAGGFTRDLIAPILAKLPNVAVRAVATASGASATSTANRVGAAYATTDYDEILDDDTIDAVIIATRHNLHAAQAIAALNAGKHVHLEKPMALSIDELVALESAAKASTGILSVGFNRRYAPTAVAMRDFLRESRGPLMADYRVAAGYIDPSHWVHDPIEGGGRILGEVCHFVDFLSFLSGSEVRSVSAARLEPKGESIQADDNVSVTLTFANGSVGTVLYTAAGGASMPKEQVQALAGTRSALLNNFWSLDLYSGRKRTVKGDGDKGHAAQFDAFVRAVREGREAPVPLDQALNSSLATLLIYRALGDGTSVRVEMPAIESGGGEDS